MINFKAVFLGNVVTQKFSIEEHITGTLLTTKWLINHVYSRLSMQKMMKNNEKRKITVNFKNKTLYRFIELSLLIGGCLSKYHIHLFWAAGWHPYIFIVLCCGGHFPEYRSTEINTPLRKAQPNTTKRLIINWLYCFARHHRRPYRPPISQTKLKWSLIFSSELIS